MKSVLPVFLVISIAFVAGCIGQEAAAPPAAPPPIGEPPAAPPGAPPAPPEVAPGVHLIASNLVVPWALAFAPDGRLFYTERPGRVGVISDGVRTMVTDIPLVYTLGESGLMGLALDPAFGQNGHVYICYTYLKGNIIVNRVSRFIEAAGIGSEQTLLDDIPGGSIHNGCRLKFGPDGKLYITTGDAGNRGLAKDLGSLGGKILRINSDGSIPSDNPFSGSPVWSYGHRNVQGIAWDPAGRMYASEHGATLNDEINLIIKGGNYGWPDHECAARRPGFEDPLLCYTGLNLAPSGIAVDEGDLYVAGLRREEIRRMSIEPQAATIRLVNDKTFKSGYGRIRAVVVGPDGLLYFATSNRDGRGTPTSDDDRILSAEIP